MDQQHKTCSRHLFSRSYFTDCFAKYEQQTLYGALVATLARLLRHINCHFIIIIIIITYYHYYYNKCSSTDKYHQVTFKEQLSVLRTKLITHLFSTATLLTWCQKS